MPVGRTQMLSTVPRGWGRARGRPSPVVLGLLGVGLGTEAAVLALRGGAKALACDSERPFLNVELEPTSPRGRCEGSESWGEASPAHVGGPAPTPGAGALSSREGRPFRAAPRTAPGGPKSEARSKHPTCLAPGVL